METGAPWLPQAASFLGIPLRYTDGDLVTSAKVRPARLPVNSLTIENSSVLEEKEG